MDPLRLLAERRERQDSSNEERRNPSEIRHDSATSAADDTPVAGCVAPVTEGVFVVSTVGAAEGGGRGREEVSREGGTGASEAASLCAALGDAKPDCAPLWDEL
mmetsp:Transcript_9910/g.10013  ORF Transcript_9910/g.10013 Transcript_9910/m.10013 type:complete len:104 (-) Transcript_9910:630-941(-)